MRIWIVLAVLATAMAGAQSAQAVPPEPKDTPAEAALEAKQLPKQKDNLVVRAVLEKLERTSSKGSGTTVATRKALHAYYEANVETPIWFTAGNTANEKTKALLVALKRADDWGLRAGDFDLSENVMNLIDESGDAARQTPEDIASAEVAISLIAIKYANHARGGRITNPSKQLSSYIDRSPPLLPVDTVMDALRETSEPDAYLEGLHPKHEQFKRLRKKLLAMRNGTETQERKPEDVKLPTSGPLLRNGKVHADVALLRKRLSIPPPPVQTAAANDGNETPNPAEVFDDAVEEAVKAYQQENGLYQDGLVGPSTRRALNNAGGGAITEDLLRANMEAWRWMPDDLGDTYVTVNIPEYKFRVIKNGEAIHEESVIIGKTNNQTPVFSDEMETVVIHPSWGVPNSIKVKELWPNLANGGRILQRQGLRVQRNGRDINPNSIDWYYADIRNYHVYQPPGSSNVLGVVKFMFPNKHQVYMHDTPTKHLFKKNVRTYSHGCMRVQNPVRLAEIVLAHDKNWTEDQVQEAIDQGPKDNKITLNSKIPVHVTYFTAVIEDDGSVRRLRDVYGHEQRIKLALAGKFNKIQKGRDHLAPVRYNRRYASEPQSFNDLFMSVFGGF